MISNPYTWHGPRALLLLACLGWGAMTTAQDTKRSESKANAAAAEAQQAFAANCAGCHGLDGRGGERAPDIVTRPKIREISDTQLFEILEKGVARTSMPPFSYLGESVLHSLVKHLRTLQGDSSAAALPGDARRGRQLFFGKGECSRCHMARGAGGFFASDLTGYARGRSPEVIHDAIVSPNRDLDPRNRTVVVTVSSGKEIEGIARNEDNFSMQLLTQDGSIYLLTKSSLKSLAYRSVSPMPADYGSRLSAAEIADLVNYLNSLSLETSKKEGGKEDEED